MSDHDKAAGADDAGADSNQSQPRHYEIDLVEPDNPLPETTLEEQTEVMRAAATRAGWSQLMPVQARTIPYIQAGRDMLIQSRTGSGKTGAFLLPIMERINPGQATCQALILVPTRELARQVAHEAELLAGDSGVHTVAVYGGVSYGPQIEGFRRGAHIVVGTPGRVLDHLLKRTLTLDSLGTLIYDEADRMLSMGFYPDMVELQRYVPRKPINSCMFSATFPTQIIRLARQFMRDPDFLSLSRDRVHVAEIEQVYYIVPHMEKDRCLVRIIEVLNPTAAIIFCNTKAMVHYVSVVLQRFGYDADELSADLTQKKREQVLARLRAGQLRFLVATDVAARGIDIPEITHIFQYEPPEDPEAYIHRAGRTGRAGASGEAISLVAGMEQTELRRIGTRFGIEMIERPLPTDEDVAEVVSERMTVLLEAQLRERDNLKAERMQRFTPLVELLSKSEEGQQLLAMLVDDKYQGTLHAPPPQPTEQAERREPSHHRDHRGGDSSKPRKRRRRSGGKDRRR